MFSIIMFLENFYCYYFKAWIRLALNDGLTESYFHAILSDKKKIR